MLGYLSKKICLLGLIWLLALPALGEPSATFLEVKIEPSVIRLVAELPYTGPQDQASLKESAKRAIAAKFAISSEADPPLLGQLKEVRFGPAIRREEISGEVKGEDPQQRRLIAVWEYPYADESTRLVFHSEMDDPAFFVTHHLGVRIHDRALLKAKQSLNLDLEDPWYSRFVQPELVRTPADSIACYLYLEPGQTRLEVLARARDVQAIGTIDLGSDTLLSLERQATAAEQFGEILKKQVGLQAKDRPFDLKLEKVQFVHRTPTSADAINPPDPVPVASATLGAMFVGPALTEKGTLKLRCQLFSPRVRSIPASVVEGDKVREVKLLPNDEGLITVEAPPEGRVLSPVAATQSRPLGHILLLAGGILVLGAVLMLRGGVGSKAFLGGSVLWLIAGLVVMKWGFGSERTVPEAQLQNLLGNIYQAFEAPTEEAVYDRLAVSVEGELLSEVYLQTRKGLEAEQGVQTTVEGVKVESATVTSYDWWGNGVGVKVFWEVSGRVGHWGHEHQRTNWYNANLKLKAVGGDWKLTELEVLDEIRT